MKLESKQAVPVAWRWLYNGKPDSDKCFSMPGPDEDVIKAASAKAYPRTVQYLYAESPTPLDSNTKRMVLELCRSVMQNVASWSLADDAEAILNKLEAGE